MGRRKEILPDDLDELEQHVRDEVASMVDAGYTSEHAFRQAMVQMGDYGEVEEAYRRVYWGKLRRQGLVGTTLILEFAMLKNYVTLALRNLARYPGYTFINVAGLAVGIACCLLILLFVQDEVSYDRFHEHADRIVRVTLRVPDMDRELEVTPTIVAPLFKRTFPEVEDAVRYYDVGRFRAVTVRVGDEAWQESGFVHADSTVFNVFTFPFIAGSPESALVRPQTLVLTESTAMRYFGDGQSALGRSVSVSGTEYEVTGVIEDVPANSHLQFDIMASFTSTHWSQREQWGSANFYTYLLLAPGATAIDLRTAMKGLLDRARSEMGLPPEFDLGLQSLSDIYLVFMGRQRFVNLLSAIAALILLIACVNYVNLATARSTRRSREVGMRKVLGAYRGQIMRQFFGESALMVSMSLILGAGLAVFLLPFFNDVSQKSMAFGALLEPRMLLITVGLLVLVSLASGIYPSLVLSGFRPASVLKGGRTTTGGNRRFREILVVFQFAVTVVLIVATTVVFRQLQFIQTTDVGFDREHVVVIPIADRAAFRSIPLLRTSLASNPAVVGMSAMTSIPGEMRGGYGFSTPGMSESDDALHIAASPVDAHAVDVLGLDLLAGESFRLPPDELARPDSANYQYVINESLVKLAGWTPESAVGQRMTVSGPNRMGTVVGVIRDFNFLDLKQDIQPQALFVEPEFNVLLIKLAGNDTAGTISDIQRVWRETTGGSPWEYSFLDDEYRAFYDAEQRLGRIFGAASLLAILIACLGLVGLASFTAEQRTKEIGVRKVMGAEVRSLVFLLNQNMTKLVLAGAVVALPVAWYVMDAWLSGFAYRTELSWWIFAGAGLSAAVIAWATVSYQSVRAATVDPVVALRYE